MQNITTDEDKTMVNNTLDIENLEKQLNEIFQNELNSQDSIFLKVSDRVVHLAALFLSGCTSRPCAIGIAGETASGKSTITYDIIDTINNFAKKRNYNELITRINTDDYYYDRSDMVKAAGSFAEFAKHYDLDVPEALELELMKKHIEELLRGHDVLLPEYDMSGTAIRRDNVKPASPANIIISEGLFTLTPKVADAFDFKIYVHVSHDIQKERFYRRAEERGLGSSSDEVYENALNKAKIHIRPTIDKADIVLSGEADREAYKVFINKILSLLD